MRKDVEYLKFMWPMRHFLITCGDINGKSNIITLSFCMPVSNTPPLIAISIGKKAYSRKLIEKYQEFIVNVPTDKLEKETYFCGYNSGKNIDKFKETKLTAHKSKNLRAPIIEECLAFMECKVTKTAKTGDKKTYIGEIIEAYAENDSYKKIKNNLALGDFPEKIYGNRFK